MLWEVYGLTFTEIMGKIEKIKQMHKSGKNTKI